jgi:hypothetical protein
VDTILLSCCDTEPVACAVALPTGNPDPLTGGGSYIPERATQALPQATPQGFVYTPHGQYQLFEASPAIEKVGAKIRELSANVPEDLQLSVRQAASGGGLDELLQVLACCRLACIYVAT